MPSNFEKKREPPVFVPVDLGDMVKLGIMITAHCRKCGHWKRLQPTALGLSMATTIPSLEGRFTCSICGSKNTCAMPEYKRSKPGDRDQG